MVKRAIPAIYPPLAAVAEESGLVVVEVKVNPNGTVLEATAVGGHKLFKTTAERSARQWLFNSTGEARSRVARLTFSFKFIEQPVSPEDLLPAFMPPYGVEIRGTAPPYVYHKNVDPPNRKTEAKYHRNATLKKATPGEEPERGGAAVSARSARKICRNAERGIMNNECAEAEHDQMSEV